MRETSCLAVLLSMLVFLVPAHLCPAEDHPLGFAAVDAQGLNGTTGGEGGPTATASDAATLQYYLDFPDPYIIEVDDTITFAGTFSLSSNKTIVGVGDEAQIVEGIFDLKDVSNIIIRNLAFSGGHWGDVDAISIRNNTHHVWIDHCDFQDYEDGLIDIKRQSSYITVSWNVFSNHNAVSLVGHSDDFDDDIGYLKITYHHNWFNGTTQRHPRVRFGECHVFNNYFTDIGSYGIGSACEADVVVEANYFKNVSNPTIIQVGSSPEGDLVERDNFFENSGTPEVRGDAFDPTASYPYTPDPAEDVPDLVMEGAGVGKLDVEPPPTEFVRGDANADGGFNLADAVFILTYLFRSGEAPACFDAADAVDNGTVDIGDAVYILQYLFASGPGIPAPFSDCGIDTTPDGLSCESHPPCA
jgi:pectate lyase